MRFLLFLSLLAATSAQASLIKGDFLNTNDGMLVTDTATGYEWLSPVYTRNHTYNDVYVQSIASTYGFHYATAQQTSDMLTNNFGNVTTTAPGDTAGYNAAQAMFTVFGIAENVYCGAIDAPCPRTQGLTSTVLTTGTHAGFGMIQFGSTGWMIANNNWGDIFADYQMGSWLIRSSGTQAAATPEPASSALIGLGLAFTGLAMRKRARSR